MTREGVLVGDQRITRAFGSTLAKVHISPLEQPRDASLIVPFRVKGEALCFFPFSLNSEESKRRATGGRRPETESRDG
jgi:hypothetical protein